MNDVYTRIKITLLYLWQLPQNLLGLAVVFFSKAKRQYINGVATPFYCTKYRFGVSLGAYVIVNENCNENTLLHELGHCFQSLYLGWLYLPMIGLPSTLRNMYDRIFHKNWDTQKRIVWYYSGYPEAQADKLGNVKREYYL